MAEFFSSIEFFLSVLSVAVIGMGGFLIMKGYIDYVDLITFQLYVTAFTTPLRKVANFSETFTNGTAGFTRFLEIMRTEPTLKDAPDAVDLPKVEGEITLEDVHFSYKQEQEVLDGVSLIVHPGEKIGVVGPSGSGKSTLCQLVPRFYDVDSGCIRVDGYDVRRATQHSLRGQIGIVQQEVFLFAASIRDNIRYGRPDATDEEVEAAARRAEIYDDIMEMPEQFDTWVGERGTLLSGGAEAARGHRAHLPEEPADPDPRRGHVRAGQRDGGAHSALVRRAGAGAHVADHRAPALDHPQCQPHSRRRRTAESSRKARMSSCWRRTANTRGSTACRTRWKDARRSREGIRFFRGRHLLSGERSPRHSIVAFSLPVACSFRAAPSAR